MNKTISVIIISYNCKVDVIECIKSIILTCYEDIPEIIVVDNNSSDDTIEALTLHFPDVKIVQNSKNMGYAYAINQGVAASSGEYIILSNADVIYPNNSISSLISTIASNNDYGLVGPQQVFKDSTYQRSFGLFPSIKRGIFDLLFINFISKKLNEIRFKKGNNQKLFVEYLDGAILAVRREVFNELNGFDEDFFFYSEEVDFCYRLNKAGYKRVLVTESKVIHHRGGSQKNSGMNSESINMLIRSELQFLLKHKSKFVAKLYFRLELWYFSLLSAANTILGNEVSKSNNKLYIIAIKKVLNEIKI